MAVTYEKRDLRTSSVLWGGAIVLAVTVAAFGCMWLLWASLLARERAASPPAHPLAASVAREQPPAPRLQSSPRVDLLALRAQEDAALGSYGWLDKNQGTVRIPIERAMQLLAERGLPARPEGSR